MGSTDTPLGFTSTIFGVSGSSLGVTGGVDSDLGGSLAGVEAGVVETGDCGRAWGGFVGVASDGSALGVLSSVERRRSLNDLLPPDENAAKPPLPLENALKAPPLETGADWAGAAATGGNALLSAPPGIEDAPKVG